MKNQLIYKRTQVKSLLLFSLACLFLSACGVSKEQEAATLVAAALQTGEAAQTATFTPSPPPPTAVLSTPTSAPSITPTPPEATPTPQPIVVVAAAGDTIAYAGPEESYAPIATLYQSQELDYVGRSENGQWIVFALTEYQNAWVNVESLLINFDIDNLEALAAPATQETKYKILIVNNTKDHWYVSIPEANIPATEIQSGGSLVFKLPPQTYTVLLGDKVPSRANIIVLSSDKTILLQPRESGRGFTTVIQ